MSSLNIRGFFLLMIPLFVAGPTNDSEKVEATKGESFVLFKIPGFEDVSKVTVRPCENGSIVFRYCSPDETKKGCKSYESDKIYFGISNNDSPVASFSDQGCYTVKVIVNSVITRSFTVVVNESQYSTVSPESQYSTVSPESPHPTSPTPTEGGLVILVTAVVLIGTGIVILTVGIICCICKKKRSQKKSPKPPAEGDALIQVAVPDEGQGAVPDEGRVCYIVSVCDGGQGASPPEKDQLLMEDLNLNSIKENDEKLTCVTGL